MADALKRTLGPGLLTAYGIGIMVGAGIYVLVGAAAGGAGVWAPVSFLLAGIVAVPTALSYSALSARIPEAAGDSSYIEVRLHRPGLAMLVGWINVVVGTVAAAAVLRGGVGYLVSITPIGFEVAVIGLGVAVTAVLYALVSMAAVRAVPREALAISERPLALVWETATGTSATFMAAIAVAAAVNGVSAQIVMAARVLYGLGKRAPMLAVFRHAHPRFGTPVLASGMVGAVLIVAALTMPVAALAEITSIALLVVFAIVNIALIALKRVAPEAPFRPPGAVPWLGLIACVIAFAAAINGALT